MLLVRLARAIDALVSARAECEVPEWRMHEVQSEIARYRNSLAAKKKPHDWVPVLHAKRREAIVATFVL